MSSPTKEFPNEAGTKINGGGACVAALGSARRVQLELPHQGADYRQQSLLCVCFFCCRGGWLSLPPRLG